MLLLSLSFFLFISGWDLLGAKSGAFLHNRTSVVVVAVVVFLNYSANRRQ